MDRLFNRWVLTPVIFIIGIIIAGSLIEDAFDIENAATKLFLATGGIGVVALFYKIKK